MLLTVRVKLRVYPEIRCGVVAVFHVMVLPILFSERPTMRPHPVSQMQQQSKESRQPSPKCKIEKATWDNQ